MRNVVCGIYARNEAQNLHLLFQSLYRQTRPFNTIVFLDDGSVDATAQVLGEILHDATTHTQIIRVKPHENYIVTNQMHITVNRLLERVYAFHPDLFMILGGDTVIHPNYLDEMLRHFIRDPKLMIGSGTVLGEPFRKDTPRGTGRLYNAGFMRQFCHPLPSSAIWETYPVYKALSMGLHVRAFPYPSMITQRSTKQYKRYYGYAMKQLGYFPLYAYLKMLRDLFRDKSTINTIRAYRQHGRVYDEQVKRWLTRYHIQRILRFDL